MCHAHHRGSSRQGTKSKWAIDRPSECHTFCSAEDLGSNDRGGLWYVSQGATRVLGTANERLAFFQGSSNPTVPWHGYPVGASSPGRSTHIPPDGVISQWREAGRIDANVEDKLRRGIL